MTRTDGILVAALYLPLALSLLAGLLRRRPPKLFAACLLSFLWAACSLLALQRLNLCIGWWTFPTKGPLFLGMPLELYFGWIVLWGILPLLALRSWPTAATASIMIAADLIVMPLCNPAVVLGPRWLIGEFTAACLVLVPALLIARWTLEDSHLPVRAAMQLAIAALLFLYLLPELAFAIRPGQSWEPLLRMPNWQRQLGLQLIALLALPGVGAIIEFAQRGAGTPIPYDPPKRLVISGIYRYCANPMQLSCALVMLMWSALLRNPGLAMAAAISVIYSAGIAEWDEARDLATRFGPEWKDYRREVHNWRIRWRPYAAGPQPRLYIAATCSPCSELRRWIEARRPLGLELIDAETLPRNAIQRLRYDPQDGSAPVEGVRAFGRALEHLNLGWALAGIALRLPLAWQTVQLLMDASGLGPRLLRDTPA